MAHLATLRDDCGLVNYTIPVKHYTIRHCQLQNNRQIAPHRILLNTIQRCSKVSKLSIAEQIFESNCELMEIMSGVFHQHTSYLSRTPRIYLCKFFLASVNFYRLREKLAFSTDFTRKSGVFFFTDLTRKIGVFRCKFYSPKILPV